MCGQLILPRNTLIHWERAEGLTDCQYDCQTYLSDLLIRMRITAKREVGPFIHSYILIVECLVFVSHLSYFENLL
jgi:hypothetical protein